MARIRQDVDCSGLLRIRAIRDIRGWESSANSWQKDGRQKNGEQTLKEA